MNLNLVLWGMWDGHSVIVNKSRVFDSDLAMNS